MQLFKTFVSALFAAAVIAGPAPDSDADDVKTGAPEFENLDSDVAAMISLASEFGDMDDGLEARSMEPRSLCNKACTALVRQPISVPPDGLY